MDFYSMEDVRADDNIRTERQPYIISQYGDSSVIKNLLRDFRKNIKPRADIDTFYKNVMDISTATGEGLEIWGSIVNLPRVVILSGGTRVTLEDDNYRRLLIYKALANISDASGATLNKMIGVLFQSAPPSVVTAISEQKNGDMYYNATPMTIRWVIDGRVDEFQLALFKLGGTLCLGAGVGWNLIAVDKANTFGFWGSGLQPFNQGMFWDGSYIDRG